jgi:membrane protease YdiL (CAAX protease family)
LQRLAIYFLLTFALTWTCFLAVLRVFPEPSPVQSGLLLLGTFAPAIVALSLLGPQRRDVLSRIFRGARFRWVLFAVAFYPAVKLAVALTYRAIAGSWPRFGGESIWIIAVAIPLSTPAQAGEELGWRGFALPRMAAAMGYARASILLGLIWALWHLPLFYLPGADKYHQSFPLWTVNITALSVAMAWLYWKTNGNLLMTMLLHSAVNQTIGIVPDADPHPAGAFSLHAPLTFYLTAGFLSLAAVLFLLDFRRAPAAARQKMAA